MGGFREEEEGGSPTMTSGPYHLGTPSSPWLPLHNPLAAFFLSCYYL
jgi:hypothetical protein